MNVTEYIKTFPKSPGCYIMKDKGQDIIYIGKAKSLKNRVSSYFTGDQTIKTQRLLQEVKSIDYIVTENEVEAFILENEMIKKHQPKYNILLKDDKTYPYIRITKEEHPRILIAREVKKNGGTYFGPYPNSKSAREVVDLLNRIYPLRKCKVLPKKECLYYHMGQCMAPCILKVTKEDYAPYLEEITSFLKGDSQPLVEDVKRKMEESSERLDFEKAKEYRDMITHIRNLQPKQSIILPDKVNRDIWGWYLEDDNLSIQVLHARNGALVEREVYHYDEVEDMNETINSFLLQFYQKHLLPKELLLPIEHSLELLSESLKTNIHQPQKGKKKTLVEMAKRNVEHAFKLEQIRKESVKKRKEKGLKELEELLGLNNINRMDMFDNAHMQGSHAVSGVVVYEKGEFKRKDYRKFRLKHENTKDDLASMKEAVERRYKRLLEENGTFPDLIVIDGGKTQWQTAKFVLDTLRIKTPMVSLVKDEHHQTRGIVDTKGIIIELDKKSDVFRMLAAIQDEVHRFVITYFRSLQQKTMKKSVLDDIPGIGEKRKKQLLQTFKSVKAIKEATIEEMIEKGIPRSASEKVWNYFNEKNERE